MNLQEFLIIITFVTGGVLGRILLQGLPSVEPITFFAILAGSLFGWKKGAATGISAWYLSNFLMFGGQGPWTLIHVFSGACAGFLGGLLHKKAGYLKTFGVITIATLLFEIPMTISSGIFFGFGIIASFFTAIPFMVAHLASNIGFSLLIPKARKIILEKGKLNEKELFKSYIKKLKRISKNEN